MRRAITFVPTCSIRNHGDVCVSCPRQKRFQDREMDERVETERTMALSWREKLNKFLRIRSNRVSGAPDAAENNITITAPSASDIPQLRMQSRRPSNIDYPLEYIPQFETNEIRPINEECPRVETEPASDIIDILQPDIGVQARLPPSISTFSTRTVRSTMPHLMPNTDINRFRNLFQVWDTRLSMKLFGSKNGIRKEEERRMNCKHWIIHPCSMFRYFISLTVLFGKRPLY